MRGELGRGAWRQGGVISTDTHVPAATRRRPLVVAAAVALVVLAGGGWFLLCDVAASRQTTAAPLPPTVGVQPAIEKGVSRSFEFVGRIKAVNEVALRARVEGFLEKAPFTEGQHVKVGQLLNILTAGPGISPSRASTGRPKA